MTEEVMCELCWQNPANRPSQTIEGKRVCDVCFRAEMHSRYEYLLSSFQTEAFKKGGWDFDWTGPNYFDHIRQLVEVEGCIMALEQLGITGFWDHYYFKTFAYNYIHKSRKRSHKKAIRLPVYAIIVIQENQVINVTFANRRRDIGTKLSRFSDYKVIVWWSNQHKDKPPRDHFRYYIPQIQYPGDHKLFQSHQRANADFTPIKPPPGWWPKPKDN
jgi:hypothetical protein